MKKLLKGLTALLGMNILIVLFSIMIQSCKDNYLTETEDSNNQVRKEAIDAYKASIKENADIYKKNLIILKRETESSPFLKTLDVICDSLDDSTSPEELLAINFETGIHNDAINLLYAYGYTDSEIIQEFGNLGSPEISVVANLVVAFEDKLDENQRFDFFEESDFEIASLLGISNAYGQDDTIGGCIMDAMGISAVFTLISEGASKKLTKMAVRKVIRKVAARSLGAVGAALAVYDFVDCMGWI